MNEYRVRSGQPVVLTTLASTAAVVRARAGIEYDDGTFGTIVIPEKTLSSSRVTEAWRSDAVAAKAGRVSYAYVEAVTSALKRGQVFARLAIGEANDGALLCQDYVYENHFVTLGLMKDPGPGGGEGYIVRLALKSDSAPAASTALNLGVGNSFRVTRKVVWYYNASADAVTRVLQIAYSNPLIAVPTGFGTLTKSEVWRSQQLTLTASQEGTLYVDGKLSVKNQDGTITVDSAASAPSPLPAAGTEGDTGDLLFTVTDGHANDRDTIYYEVEEWLVI